MIMSCSQLERRLNLLELYYQQQNQEKQQNQVYQANQQDQQHQQILIQAPKQVKKKIIRKIIKTNKPSA